MILGIISAILGGVALVMGVVALFNGDTPRATLLWVGALICERDFRMRERQLNTTRKKMEQDLVTNARYTLAVNHVLAVSPNLTMDSVYRIVNGCRALLSGYPNPVRLPKEPGDEMTTSEVLYAAASRLDERPGNEDVIVMIRKRAFALAQAPKA